jgi:hypothetical protein
MDLHATKFIHHHGRTHNYRREGDMIVCDDKDMPDGISYNGPIPPEAVVVHGCKDGSLSRLLVSPTPEANPPDAVKRPRGRPKKVVESLSWETLTQPSRS